MLSVAEERLPLAAVRPDSLEDVEGPPFGLPILFSLLSSPLLSSLLSLHACHAVIFRHRHTHTPAPVKLTWFQHVK